MTTTAPPSPRTGRAPLPLRAACVLLTLLLAASTFGLVTFGILWGEGDVLGTGLVFSAVALAGMATAAASLPRLLRGERRAWLLVLGWTIAYDYWTVYKVFGEPEPESWPFLVVGLSVLALLVSPRTRTHVGAEEL